MESIQITNITVSHIKESNNYYKHTIPTAFSFKDASVKPCPCSNIYCFRPWSSFANAMLIKFALTHAWQLNQQCCASTKDFFIDNPLGDGNSVKESPTSDVIQTHDLSVSRRLLHRCATTTVQFSQKHKNGCFLKNLSEKITTPRRLVLHDCWGLIFTDQNTIRAWYFIL